MSKHRMPPGGGANKKDTPDVPEATAAVDEQTTSSAAEPVETGVELTQATEESTVEPATPQSTDESSDESVDELPEEAKPRRAWRQINWVRVVAYGVLPGIALVLAMAAGYLKWQDNSVRDSDRARAEAMQTAKDSTVKMLSYKPDSVGRDLNSARELLTGDFRDQYTALINDVVIPGAQQKQISAVAAVPAMGSVSVDPNKAVVLLFVNQTVAVGQEPPTDTASSVRVTLEKVGDRWLIAQFDPV